MTYVVVACLGFWVGQWAGFGRSLYRDRKQAQTVFNTGYIRGNIDAVNKASEELRKQGMDEMLIVDTALAILSSEAPDYGSIIQK